MRFCIFIVFLLLAFNPVSAEPISDEFLITLAHGDEQEKFFASGFMAGILNGLSAANSHLSITGERMMYCQPENLALTVDQGIQILKSGIEKRPLLGKISVTAATLQAMEITFPCQNK